MTNAPLPFTLTNDSITVVCAGKAHTVQKDAANFHQLRDAVLEGNWDLVPGLVTEQGSLETYARKIGWRYGAAGLFDSDGHPVHEVLVERMEKMARAGEDPSALMNFWIRLMKNPSMRSVEQLYGFLAHAEIPFEPDGHFLAYKGVTEDLRDVHSKTYDNSPGKIHEMPRNQISDDPREACHAGFHVGAKSYARGFGPRTMICRVDPADVVSVPYDESAMKIRVCKYEVVGHDLTDDKKAAGMPSTTFVDDTRDEDEGDDYYDGEDEDEGDDFLEEIERDLREKHQVTPAFENPPAPAKKPAKTPALGRLDAKGLINASLADLRIYASKTLKIVGASKLAGGKTALVKRILKIRKKGAK